MKSAIRVKDDPSFKDFAGMFMTESSGYVNGDYIQTVKAFESEEEAQLYLDNLYFGQNWEVVPYPDDQNVSDNIEPSKD